MALPPFLERDGIGYDASITLAQTPFCCWLNRDTNHSKQGLNEVKEALTPTALDASEVGRPTFRLR